MFEVAGLYGHTKRNIRISNSVIAAFFLATCVCWILCSISYNVGFRYFFGEEIHQDMLAGGGTFAHSGGRRIDISRNASKECRNDYSKCREIVVPVQPTILQLIKLGAITGVTTLYIPIIGVLAWLGIFWFQNQRIVSWAVGAIPASRTLEKRIYNIVENQSIQLGMPMPRIELIKSNALNAFASGLRPEDSTICRDTRIARQTQRSRNLGGDCP